MEIILRDTESACSGKYVIRQCKDLMTWIKTPMAIFLWTYRKESLVISDNPKFKAESGSL